MPKSIACMEEKLLTSSRYGTEAPAFLFALQAPWEQMDSSRRLMLSKRLGANRLKPAADVDLCVGFAAIMARMGGVGGLLGPFKYRQLLVAAMNDHPFHRVLAFLTAYLTTVNPVNHFATSP